MRYPNVNVTTEDREQFNKEYRVWKITSGKELKDLEKETAMEIWKYENKDVDPKQLCNFVYSKRSNLLRDEHDSSKRIPETA